jgi:hypothetical protein
MVAADRGWVVGCRSYARRHAQLHTGPSHTGPKLRDTYISCVCLCVCVRRQVLVRQINAAVHIPDFVFAFGDEAVKDTFQFFILMPALIISAKLSPPSVEGSMYALVTMTSNISGVSQCVRELVTEGRE